MFAICGYSLIQGGGEYFHYLANELKKQGIAVTLLILEEQIMTKESGKNWIEIYH